MTKQIAWFIGVLLLPTVVQGSDVGDAGRWASLLSSRYNSIPNVTYRTANDHGATNYEATMDVYRRLGAGQVPTLVYIHGGGWYRGSKEKSFLQLIPYFEMGWTVVNIEYRRAPVSPAPAAVEDCRCALRWVIQHAEEYNVDTNKLVLSGHSAGGHLSLITGMLPSSAGFDGGCTGKEELKVAAIINWYGITDVSDVFHGPNKRSFATRWLSGAKNHDELAGRLSPVNQVRKDLPPILSVHGDADPTVPYAHAVELHQRLTAVDVPNKLVTVPGGEHWGFTEEQVLDIWVDIRKFLETHELQPLPFTKTE